MISRQQAAERAQEGVPGRAPKETGKGRADAAKRAAFVSTIGAWLVRHIGVGRHLGPADAEGDGTLRREGRRGER